MRPAPTRAGGLNKAGTEPGKGTGYLAMNARVRDAAATLTKLTGETWTPAEVQETIWSWAKTVYEMSAQASEPRSARQLVEEGAITDDLINSTPDFGTLFHNPPYAAILKDAGYGQQLEGAQRPDAGAAQQGPGARRQAAPFAGETQRRHELAAARRLERLQDNRGNAKAAGREQKLEEALDAAATEFADNQAGAFTQRLLERGGVRGGDGQVAVDSRPQQGDRGKSLAGLPSSGTRGEKLARCHRGAYSQACGRRRPVPLWSASWGLASR